MKEKLHFSLFPKTKNVASNLVKAAGIYPRTKKHSPEMFFAYCGAPSCSILPRLCPKLKAAPAGGWCSFKFGTPDRIWTCGPGLRSMAYHVIHGSDVTSNIIPYAEWLVVNELYGAKHLFWRSFMCPLGGPISKFLARGHPAKADCYCHSSLP